MALRDFLYLDRPLVRDFLAQAEGGVVDQATERETSAGRGEFGGRIGFGPASVGAGRSNQRSLETEAVVHQVAASEFDRLYTYLELDELTIIEDVADSSAVSGIRRKQFLEVDARIRISGLHQLLQIFSTFGALAPMMEQLGTDIQIDQSTMAGMQALSSLTTVDPSIPVIATVPGTANFKVGLALNPLHTLVDTWDVEASVLLKVQRVIRGDEGYLVGDPLGGLLKLIPQQHRQGLYDSLNSPEASQFGISGEIEIRAPGVIGTPIAIFR